MEKKEEKDWTIPDDDGNIHVPDELDKLVNKIGFQLRFHTISGKGEVQTVCDIARIAQEYFKPIEKLYTKDEVWLHVQEALKRASEGANDKQSILGAYGKEEIG